MYEQKFIDGMRPEFNICAQAGTTFGLKHSDSTREKISKAQSGRKKSIETRIKMSAVAKSRIYSAESRLKMKNSALKRWRSAEGKTAIKARTADYYKKGWYTRRARTNS